MVWCEGGQDRERERRQQRGSQRRGSDAGTVRSCTVLVAPVEPQPRTASWHLRNLVRQPPERLHAARREGRCTFRDDGTVCGEACALFDTARATNGPATASTQEMACGTTALGRYARCPREKSKRGRACFSGARVARSASVLGCETPAAQGHRGTWGYSASMRDAEFRRARVVNTSRTGCGCWTDGTEDEERSN